MSRSRANFAVLLLKRLFDPSELEGKNIAGVRGKGQVNPVKATALRRIQECKNATALRRIRKFIPMDVMGRLYKAFILPHLEYCAPLLLGVGKTQVNKLDVTNYYILRSILGFGRQTPYEFLLKTVGIRSLKQRREFQALVVVYKCIHNQAPSYIQNLFKIKLCSYNLRGSGTILEMPRCNLEWRHKSFSFIAARIWNSLPSFIREAEDLSTFKRLLNDYYK